MIIQNGGIEEVEKQLVEDEARSKKLKKICLLANKCCLNIATEILNIVYDRIIACTGTIITDCGHKFDGVIDEQDVIDAICYTIEEIKEFSKVGK